jgi:hypothetical protein
MKKTATTNFFGLPSISSTTKSSPSSTTSTPTTGGHSFGIFKKNTAPPPLSEEEKQQRREMLTKAAKERSDKWDKKAGGGSSKKSSENTINKPLPTVNTHFNEDRPLDAETQRVIQMTKEMEKKTEQVRNESYKHHVYINPIVLSLSLFKQQQELGYNPFRPFMSSAGNSAPGISSSSSSSSPPPPNSLNIAPPPRVAAPNTDNSPRNNTNNDNNNNNNLLYGEGDNDESELMIAEVDDAFAMLLSLGEADQEKAKIAVQTVQKMLQNLQVNGRSDPKFRSIRLTNAAFQAKVACICGAVELLLAAGYRYEFNDPNNRGDGGSPPPVSSSTTTATARPEEASMTKNNRYSQEEEESSSAHNNNNNNEENNLNPVPYYNREGFLIHPMDRLSVRKLTYTLSR